MKKHTKFITGVGIFLFFFLSLYAFSDTPPDPPGGGPGGGDLPVGGGAPLFGGTEILISLGLGYLFFKVKSLIAKK